MYSIRRSLLRLRFRSPYSWKIRTAQDLLTRSSPKKTPEPFEPSFANSFSRHPTGFDWPNRQNTSISLVRSADLASLTQICRLELSEKGGSSSPCLFIHTSPVTERRRDVSAGRRDFISALSGRRSEAPQHPPPRAPSHSALQVCQWRKNLQSIEGCC